MVIWLRRRTTHSSEWPVWVKRGGATASLLQLQALSRARLDLEFAQVQVDADNQHIRENTLFIQSGPVPRDEAEDEKLRAYLKRDQEVLDQRHYDVERLKLQVRQMERNLAQFEAAKIKLESDFPAAIKCLDNRLAELNAYEDGVLQSQIDLAQVQLGERIEKRLQKEAPEDQPPTDPLPPVGGQKGPERITTLPPELPTGEEATKKAIDFLTRKLVAEALRDLDRERLGLPPEPAQPQAPPPKTAAAPPPASGTGPASLPRIAALPPQAQQPKQPAAGTQPPVAGPPLTQVQYLCTSNRSPENPTPHLICAQSDLLGMHTNCAPGTEGKPNCPYWMGASDTMMCDSIQAGPDGKIPAGAPANLMKPETCHPVRCSSFEPGKIQCSPVAAAHMDVLNAPSPPPKVAAIPPVAPSPQAAPFPPPVEPAPYVNILDPAKLPEPHAPVAGAPAPASPHPLPPPAAAPKIAALPPPVIAPAPKVAPAAAQAAPKPLPPPVIAPRLAALPPAPAAPAPKPAPAPAPQAAPAPAAQAAPAPKPEPAAQAAPAPTPAPSAAPTPQAAPAPSPQRSAALPPPTKPVCTKDSVTGKNRENAATNMTVSSNHPCGGTFRVTGEGGGEEVLLKLVSPPGHGTVMTDGIATYAYTSNRDFKGEDSFTLHSAWISAKSGKRGEADFTYNVMVK